MRDWSSYCFMATLSSRAPDRMAQVFPVTVLPFSFSLCQSCFPPQPPVNFPPTNIICFPRSLACNARYSIMLKWNRTIESINPEHVSLIESPERGEFVYQHCSMCLVNSEASLRNPSEESGQNNSLVHHSLFSPWQKRRPRSQRCCGHALSTHLDLPFSITTNMACDFNTGA